MWSLRQPLSLPVIFQPKAWEAGGAITIFFWLQIDSLGIDILQLAHIPRWYPVFFFPGRWNFQGNTSLREGFKKISACQDSKSCMTGCFETAWVRSVSWALRRWGLCLGGSLWFPTRYWSDPSCRMSHNFCVREGRGRQQHPLTLV